MGTQNKATKKFWKPPSFEDFNSILPTKKIKLDPEEFSESKTLDIPNEASEPKNIEELAIHPKKIEEVRNWIKGCGREKAPILLVTGPAGSGKTVTVKVSAKSEGVLVKEWINPVDKTLYKAESVLECDLYENDRYNFCENKQTDKFEEFVFRSSRYNSLFEGAVRTLIMVEDIPNIFIWRPKLFHEFLEKYKRHGQSPIIFVVTDDQNLNLHNDLFPSHVKNKFCVTNVKFNPVNHSSLIKNLKSLTECYCPEKVSSQFLESVCKNSSGDLRSATNDLLLFLRTNVPSGNKQPEKLPKRLKKNDGLWATSKPLTAKDASLDFYHVLGRILYPKKLSESERTETDNPSRIFVHDVHKIAESWNHSFLSILHENYLQTFGKFADVVGGAECFSFCDIFGYHQELEQYSSLCGVISLMSKNTEPKKKGFNPIKKSFRMDSNNFDFNSESGMELINHVSSQRNTLLDLIPFRKIIQQGQLGNELAETTPSVSFDLPAGEHGVESDEDVIEIEEYDD